MSCTDRSLTLCSYGFDGVFGSRFRAPPALPARALRSDSAGVGAALLALAQDLPRGTLAKPVIIRSSSLLPSHARSPQRIVSVPYPPAGSLS